jgi:HK97 family phage major capsid protein
MKMKDLLEQRGRIVAEMRKLADSPTGEGGDMTVEQSQRFDTLKGELESTEKNIDRQNLLDEAERRMQGQPLTGTGDERLDDELRKFSLTRAIASQVPDLNVDGGRERELSKELAQRMGVRERGIMVPMQVFEKRVITSAAPAAGPGSNIIATDHMGNLFIDRLRAALKVNSLGARVLNGLQGNVDIPKLKASATAGWVAENAALGASDMQFTKVSMTPKHAGCLTEFSRNMLLQTSPDIESLVRDDFAKVLAEAVDSVAINGGGSNEPDGILQSASTVDHTMATPSWSNLLELIGLVEDANVEGNAFLGHPAVLRALRRTLKDADNPELGYIMPERDNLAGYPVARTTLGPTISSPESGTLIFGAWEDLILGYWSAFEILVNPFETTAYSKGNVQVRGMLTCDVAVRHAESFAASQNVGIAA